MQGVIQRLQIGIKLVLHVPGQKAQPLSCLHGRSGQDYLLNLVVLQSSDSQGYCSICLPGAGRTFCNDQVTVVIFLYKLNWLTVRALTGRAIGAEDKCILKSPLEADLMCSSSSRSRSRSPSSSRL
jgi:hypothetical protein